MKTKSLFIIVVSIIIVFISLIFLKNLKIEKVEDNSKFKFEESSFYNNYYTKKDTLLVLYVWESWSRPSIENILTLDSLRINNSKNNNIIFLSLSKDTEILKIKKSIQSRNDKIIDISIENLNYTKKILNKLNNIKDSDFSLTISTSTIPTTYFILNQKVVKKIEGQIDSKVILNEINSLSISLKSND